MSVRETIKTLLLKEHMTLTELAEMFSKQTNKPYTVDGLSRKLQNETMKYNEAEKLINLIGYDIKLVKKL
jgi:hypothetical protein